MQFFIVPRYVNGAKVVPLWWYSILFVQALETLQLYFCFPYLCTISAWVCPELPYPLSFHSLYFSLVFLIMFASLLYCLILLFFLSILFIFIWWNTYKLQFSRYLVAFSMMWYLNQRVMILPPRFEELQFGGYLKSGEWLFLRCVFQDSFYLINKLTSVLVPQQSLDVYCISYLYTFHDS